MTAPLLVIGIGNAYRGDDGAGPAVSRALAAREIPGVRAIAHSGEAATLMEAWQGAECVALVDAAVSGGKPGTVHRFDAIASPIPVELFPRFSTHGFSVVEAVELARVLDALPTHLVVYGIEAESLEEGAGLTPAVSRAVEEVAARIAAEATP